MENFKRGLIIPRAPMVLRARNYFSLSRLATTPATYGRDMSKVAPQMFENDRLGDCVEAAMQNATIIWSEARGVLAPFNDATSTAIYTQMAGYNPADLTTDQGTDMLAAAKIWKASGITDARATAHKIAAYLWIDKGDVEMHLIAGYQFEVLLVGVTIGDEQEDQFSAGEPWSGIPVKNLGGHCVAQKGHSPGFFHDSSWMRWEQPMTEAFLATQGVGTIVPLSLDMLNPATSPEGFDVEALNAYLSQLQQEAA
jgi:hypothetical protein